MEKRISEKYINSKGITLIALVITIVVMLILVSVSIQVAMDSGLFGSAGKVVKDYKKEQDKESNMKVTIGGVTYNSIQDYLNNNPQEEEKKDEEEKENEEEEETDIVVKLAMIYREEEVIADGTKVSSITESVPIPAGYYYVGGTKNTGLVISDSSSDENKGVDADLDGNQFVWIPVLQNQQIKVDVQLATEITSIKITDPLGAEIATDAEGNIITASGKKYNGIIKPTINGIYQLTVGTASNDMQTQNLVETLDVSSLYAQDFFGASGTGYVDSAILIYSENVNKYGGFYIARYEAGNVSSRNEQYSDWEKEYGVELAKAYSKKNMYPYNWITQEDAIMLSQAMDNGSLSVTSDLINSATWDRTINWLIETNAVTEAEAISDSTSWGNYDNAEFTVNGKYKEGVWNEGTKYKTQSNLSFDEIGTGATEYTRKNNIYDLAGNCHERVGEVNKYNSAICRGGKYLEKGYSNPANSRVTDYPHEQCYGEVGFRSVLFINL